MNYAEPLSQRHPARMPLSPQQHSHIAAAYDKAAFDISLPAHTRAALLRKQIGSVCLPALEKRDCKRRSRNKKPKNHRRTRLGS